jgi:hypothetical protein
LADSNIFRCQVGTVFIDRSYRQRLIQSRRRVSEVAVDFTLFSQCCQGIVKKLATVTAGDLVVGASESFSLVCVESEMSYKETGILRFYSVVKDRKRMLPSFCRR